MFKRLLKRVANSVVNNAVNTVVNNVNREVSQQINNKMVDFSDNIKKTSDLGNEIIENHNNTINKLNGISELEYCKELLSRYREPLLMNINLDDYEDLYLDKTNEEKYDFFRSLYQKNEIKQGYEDWGNNYYKTKSNTFLVVDKDCMFSGNFLSLNLVGDYADEAYHMTYSLNDDVYSIYYSGDADSNTIYHKNAMMTYDKNTLDNLIDKDRYRNVFFSHLLDSYKYPDKEDILIKKFNDDYYLFKIIVDDEFETLCLVDDNGYVKEISYFSNGIHYYFMDTVYQAKFSIRMRDIITEANYKEFKNFNCIE